MCHESFPFQKLSANNTISKELTWLANHIERSDSVHIIQSQEWSRSEVHTMFLCDACPAGMRYWSLTTCEGFICTISPDTHNVIFFFKALTVVSALSHVCESTFQNLHHLAILTDSSNTFDMLNTLHALPAHNSILITATDLLIASGIQLRVFHIPCKCNKVADALSCLDGSTAHHLQPELSITYFSPPRFMLGEVQL